VSSPLFWSSFARLRIIGPSCTCLCVTWVTVDMYSSLLVRSILPIPFLHYGCTIASLSHQARKETTSTEVCLVPCLRWLGTSTTAQTLASGGKGFHHRNLRRVVPEPWQWSQDEVHSQKLRWAWMIGVALRTCPWEQKVFRYKYAPW
jgi:hypothetical protein